MILRLGSPPQSLSGEFLAKLNVPIEDPVQIIKNLPHLLLTEFLSFTCMAAKSGPGSVLLPDEFLAKTFARRDHVLRLHVPEYSIRLEIF